MTTTRDLAEAFDRLVAGLSWIEEHPDGPARAQTIRARLAEHFNQLSDSLAEKSGKCRTHPTQPGHNCGPCRSERIGLEPGTAFNPAALPPTPAAVRDQENARWPE